MAMAGELIAEEVMDYLEQLVPPRPDEMVRMEAYAAEHQFPIIGPAAGYACYQIARIAQARRVFELGSGYGYSTAWFAKAVQENGGGIVHHVVWDEELSSRARQHLGALGYGEMIRYTVGEAVEALGEVEGPFDLIFSDINKEAYPKSLDVIAAKLKPGGVLIVDNALWSGRIFDRADRSVATEAIRQFNQRVSLDPAWIAVLLPIRDGLMVAYKR
jgi:caffeoyl-CoA O-methyltransferase